MPVYSWLNAPRDLIPNSTLPAGMSRRSILGENVMLCLHEAFPNLKCNPYQHPSEQFSVVLKGRVRFIIGDEERVLGPGELAHIPGNVPHSIESLDEYVLVLDVFAPKRSDILTRLEEIEGGGAHSR
jgi:hypothetical protein